jgi:carboxymethylenebutenolidase
MNSETPGAFRVADPARRSLLLGAACALPLAVVLKDPRLARAASETLQEVAITTAGGRTVKAALALPAAERAPSVLLVHEWWGLNDQIRAVAAELASLGYVALAVDLYGGPAATTPEEAKAKMSAMQPAEAIDTLVSWVAWLKGHQRSSGKVATVGWCFGGGWSLNTALATPTDGCVVYYGRVNKSPEELAPLACPVLGHFALQDQNINKAMVDGFLAAAKAANKDVTVYWYDADHAFANPTGARYDQADAALAWERTTAYLKDRLG